MRKQSSSTSKGASTKRVESRQPYTWVIGRRRSMTFGVHVESKNRCHLFRRLHPSKCGGQGRGRTVDLPTFRGSPSKIDVRYALVLRGFRASRLTGTHPDSQRKGRSKGRNGGLIHRASPTCRRTLVSSATHARLCFPSSSWQSQTSPSNGLGDATRGLCRILVFPDADREAPGSLEHVVRLTIALDVPHELRV